MNIVRTLERIASNVEPNKVAGGSSMEMEKFISYLKKSDVPFLSVEGVVLTCGVCGARNSNNPQYFESFIKKHVDHDDDGNPIGR